MSNDSFDRNELRKLRELLDDVARRVANLEHHAGLDPSPLTPEIADPVVTATAADPHEVDADAVVDAEIVFSEIRQPATSLTGAEESALPASVRRPAKQGESIESLIGGRVFTWAGGVLLVLATAFFVVWSWRKTTRIHLTRPQPFRTPLSTPALLSLRCSMCWGEASPPSWTRSRSPALTP